MFWCSHNSIIFSRTRNRLTKKTWSGSSLKKHRMEQSQTPLIIIQSKQINPPSFFCISICCIFSFWIEDVDDAPRHVCVILEATRGERTMHTFLAAPSQLRIPFLFPLPSSISAGLRCPGCQARLNERLKPTGEGVSACDVDGRPGP